METDTTAVYLRISENHLSNYVPNPLHFLTCSDINIQVTSIWQNVTIVQRVFISKNYVSESILDNWCHSCSSTTATVEILPSKQGAKITIVCQTSVWNMKYGNLLSRDKAVLSGGKERCKDVVHVTCHHLKLFVINLIVFHWLHSCFNCAWVSEISIDVTHSRHHSQRKKMANSIPNHGILEKTLD